MKEEDQQYCIHCGKEIEKNALYCKHCGKPQSSAASKHTESLKIKDQLFSSRDHIQEIGNLSQNIMMKAVLLVRDLVLLSLVCFACTGVTYLGAYLYNKSNRPPIISRERNIVFVQNYIEPFTPEGFRETHYRISSFPEDVIDSWSGDESLRKITFSNRKRININVVRFEQYQRDCQKLMTHVRFFNLWGWIITFFSYFIYRTWKHMKRLLLK